MEGLPYDRPFRAPHHSATTAGLIGGARSGWVGEVVLAHHGVLFLDELTEFARPTLEALRQPLEDGCVVIVRARHSAIYPARFMLIAATNPLLDRIDLFPCVEHDDQGMLEAKLLIISSGAGELVLEARERQAARFGECRGEVFSLFLERIFGREIIPKPNS
jgi:predicted ATPase with chaperone activity